MVSSSSESLNTVYFLNLTTQRAVNHVAGSCVYMFWMFMVWLSGNGGSKIGNAGKEKKKGEQTYHSTDLVDMLED